MVVVCFGWIGGNGGELWRVVVSWIEWCCVLDSCGNGILDGSSAVVFWMVAVQWRYLDRGLLDMGGGGVFGYWWWSKTVLPRIRPCLHGENCGG